MSTKNLKNIPLKSVRKFLKKAKCYYKWTKGSHEIYDRKDLTRTLTLPNNKDPVRPRVLKNNLDNLGYSKDDFFYILEGRKIVEEKEGVFIIKDKK